MSTQAKIITCPRCGNTNAFDADQCLKCGMALGPVRQLLAKEALGIDASGKFAGTERAAPEREKEPPPPLPDLPPRQKRELIGTLVDSERFLIRGMGDRAAEIAARFFGQLNARNISGLQLGSGQLSINTDGKADSRVYYFAERDLGHQARAIMAVQIAPIGTDLFVEWRHYAVPPLGAFHWGIFLGVGGIGAFIMVMTLGCFMTFAVTGLSKVAIDSSSILGIGFNLLCFGTLGVGTLIAWGKARKGSLQGFQFQDNTAFQLAVRAALEEAIDLAGISKALIQHYPKDDEKKPNRLI